MGPRTQMRRKRLERYTFPESFDIRRDFDPERLKLIGAIILAWNQIEHRVDSTMTIAAHIHPMLDLEFTSRINGFDGKIAIIKAAQTDLGELSPMLTKSLASTWSAAEEFKRYRDGVAHALLVSRSETIVDTAQRRGK